MDIQQGNLLKLETLDRVEVGMTKSQIKYLLGGPLVGTPFEKNRWDYIITINQVMTVKLKDTG